MVRASDLRGRRHPQSRRPAQERRSFSTSNKGRSGPHRQLDLFLSPEPDLHLPCISSRVTAPTQSPGKTSTVASTPPARTSAPASGEMLPLPWPPDSLAWPHTLPPPARASGTRTPSNLPAAVAPPSNSFASSGTAPSQHPHTEDSQQLHRTFSGCVRHFLPQPAVRAQHRSHPPRSTSPIHAPSEC